MEPGSSFNRINAQPYFAYTLIMSANIGALFALIQFLCLAFCLVVCVCVCACARHTHFSQDAKTECRSTKIEAQGVRRRSQQAGVPSARPATGAGRHTWHAAQATPADVSLVSQLYVF